MSGYFSLYLYECDIDHFMASQCVCLEFTQRQAYYWVMWTHKSVAKIQLQKEFISKYTIGLLTNNQQTKLLKLQTKTPAERLRPPNPVWDSNCHIENNVRETILLFLISMWNLVLLIIKLFVTQETRHQTCHPGRRAIEWDWQIGQWKFRLGQFLLNDNIKGQKSQVRVTH